MTDVDPQTWEDQLVAYLRAHGGEAPEGPLHGHPLMIATTTGARTGEPRRSILTFSRDGDAYVVAGTAGGSPTTPGWVHNLRANPSLDVEATGETWQGTAEVLEDGPERDRLWAQHVAQLPWFADYPEQVGGRVIPLVRITRA